MAKALVLGATGHIGSHIVRALLADGHHVRAAHRSDRFLHLLDGLPIERVRVDLDSLEGLPGALQGCDWVFHAAGYYPHARERQEQAIEQAVGSTRRILEQIAQASPSRLVFTSSASTIGPPGPVAHRARHSAATSMVAASRPASEQDQEPWPITRPLSLYATVKIAMEREVLRACGEGLPAVIVNPSICLGEFDAHKFSGQTILLFAKGRLPCYLDCMMNFVYTGDVGVGHVRAAERGRLGERYILTGQAMPMKEFAALVAREAGVPPPRWCLPYSLAMVAAAAAEGVAWITRTQPLLSRRAVSHARSSRALDGTKAVTELALPHTPIDEAVRQALGWFRAHGDL